MNFGTEPDGRPRDGTAFVVQGIIGLIFGAVIGMFALGRSAHSVGEFWVMTGVCAGIVGLRSAFFGDRFWDAFFSLWR